MLDLKNVFENKKYDGNESELIELANDLYSLSWEQAYWLAKCLDECGPDGITDSKLIELFEYVFDEGLTASINYEYYIKASEKLARLYIKNKDFDYANNILMELTRIMNPVPDWVYINYCLAQIYSDTVYRHAVDPVFFFKLLDSISMDSFSIRAGVYQKFLNKLYEIKENEPQRKINIQQFEDLKYKYIGHSFDNE